MSILTLVLNYLMKGIDACSLLKHKLTSFQFCSGSGSARIRNYLFSHFSPKACIFFKSLFNNEHIFLKPQTFQKINEFEVSTPYLSSNKTNIGEFVQLLFLRKDPDPVPKYLIKFLHSFLKFWIPEMGFGVYGTYVFHIWFLLKTPSLFNLAISPK